MTSSRYEHQPLDEEVRTTAGYQVTTAEFRLPFLDQEVLYLTGYSVFDSS